MGGKGDRRNVENRWWVDQGGTGQPIERPPAKFGHTFFRSGEGYEQNRAQLRLTDLNLKWFDETETTPGKWSIVHLLPRDRFPQGRLEKVRALLALPPGCRGILVDSGASLRAIATGEPRFDRIVELRFGGDNSFDAWVRGEWVREALFRHFHDALRRAPRLLREYLTTARGAGVA